MQLASVGTTLDSVVIVVYLAAVLGFGSYFGRFGKSTRDFFFSGQRFSWWLIAMSMAATGIGSHSFLKYAQKGYESGLSSGMSYTSDWFFIPFFMFGWLPIIYFSRVRSIPEYFERRFNTPCRIMAVLIILEYMIGYIGYNLFTLGTVAHQILGIDVTTAICIIAVVSCVYITAGGQTAVIFTDLLQGFMLLLAGFVLFILGLDYLALDGTILDGLSALWANLSLSERLPFADFNEPPSFNFVGVFWQDGVAGSIMFLFISQGLMMRFLAAKSMSEGRKCISFNVLIMLPLSMIVVGNAGWLCNAAVDMGLINEPEKAREAFVAIASQVCKPGVFGFVLAALSAALMSTIDTMTNASSALFVYDVYQPYLAKNRSDRHYLRSARFATVCTSAIGLALGLLFTRFGTDMYKIHGMFQAFVAPPIVAAVFMGAFWKRFTSAGALSCMLGGIICIALSKQFPQVVEPFAKLHNVRPDDHGQYNFMTALFGLVSSATIGIIVTMFTKPRPAAEIAGLCCSSLDQARRFFKGGEPSYKEGRKVTSRLSVVDEAEFGLTPVTTTMPDAPSHQPVAQYPVVRLSDAAMLAMNASPGDLLYIGDARWWLGGLRSLHVKAGPVHNQDDDVVLISHNAREHGNLIAERQVRIEKLF